MGMALNRPHGPGMTNQELGVAARLRAAGLRPTRQRLTLGTLLFGKGDRHVTAEQLHLEAVKAGERVSLATVYNALHQFCAAGLLSEVTIDGTKTHFDTNTSAHCHFYLERDGSLVDIPGSAITVTGIPTPPPGTRVAHVDVIVRLERE